MAWSSAHVHRLTAAEVWAAVQRVTQEALDKGQEPHPLQKHQVYTWFLHYEVGLSYAERLLARGDELQVSVRSGPPTQPGSEPPLAVFIEGSALDVSVWVATPLDPSTFGPENPRLKARIYKPRGATLGLRREGPWLIIPTER